MKKLLSFLFSTLQGGVRRELLLLLLVASVSAIYASDIKVGGIWYDFDSSTMTASVTYRGDDYDSYDGEYSGAVVIPETVTYDGTTYSVTSIGYAAFYGCSSLTSVTIGKSVTSIGVGAFFDCPSLTSVTIPNSVTSIGVVAFFDCPSLTSVTIPNSVTSIGSQAFEGCSSLTSVTIPNSVTSIGVSAFYGCSKLTKTNYTGDIAGWCNIGFDDSSANPMYYSHNFYINDQEIKDLVIPNSVTSIGSYAFNGCSSLTSVTIGKSVTSIGNGAFEGCSSLPVKNNLRYADTYLVEAVNKTLSTYSIKEGTKWVGSHAFSDCSSLTSMTIPNSVTSIEYRAFSGCSSLTSVTIGKSVTSIGSSAFYNCSALTSVTINSDAIVSKDYSYGDNISPIFGSQVTEYIIGESVTSIGRSAFYNCYKLTSVTIGESVEHIGNYAFQYCSSLTSVTIGESVTSIGNWAFEDCSSLTSVTIPESVTSIGLKAFYGCSSLTKTNYTGDIAGWCNIGFYDSRANPMYYSHNFYINDQEIKDLVIPNSVTSIGRSAFEGCSSLTSVTCEAETPPTVGQHAFDGVSISIPVYVPCGCVEAYKAASGWKNFTNIQLVKYSIEVDVNDTRMGSAKVDWNRACDAQISAIPNIGYHFVQWNDGNTENPRTLELTQDTILTAEFAQSFSGQCGDSLYWELVDTTLQITGKGEMYDYKPDSAPWKLFVSSIKVLTIAEDVTSIERSAFSNCPALESVVWNAKNYTNPTNKEVAPFYDICSQIKSFTFGENVEHIPAYLCYGMDKLTSVTTPNSLKTIGTSAFEGCARLGKISLGTGLEEIAANAFAGCTRLYDIYVYATYPPFAEESSFANYNVYVYIPCEYQKDYTLDVVWGKFKFIECIESEDVTTDGVLITPSTNDVTITWPTEGNADTYTIVIKKGDTVFCTLTFNADGQLLNIAFAPGRNGNHPAQYAEQAGNGYRFTITGLESGTKYGYNIDVKDASNKTIKSHSGEFTTQSTTAVENTHSQSPISNCQKILYEDHILILRDGKTYTIMGAEIK